MSSGGFFSRCGANGGSRHQCWLQYDILYCDCLDSNNNNHVSGISLSKNLFLAAGLPCVSLHAGL
jgi:hypothetical protein